MEREKFFLDFDAIEYFNGIASSLSSYAADGASEMEKYLTEKSDIEAKVVSSAVNEMLKLVNDKVDRNFDKFELYCMRNIFRLPSGLSVTDKLKEPKNQTEEVILDEKTLGKEINGLNQEFLDRRRSYYEALTELRESEMKVQYLTRILEIIERGKVADKETAREIISLLRDVNEVMLEIPHILEKVNQKNQEFVDLYGDASLTANDVFDNTFADRTLLQDERLGFFVGDKKSVQDAGLTFDNVMPRETYNGIRYTSLDDLEYVLAVLKEA